METDPIDMLMDENNADNILLYNEDGEPVEFEQIALILLNGETFVLLRPVVTPEFMSGDEALVFVIETIDDEDVLTVVEDEDIVDAVFEEYYIMLEEAGVDAD